MQLVREETYFLIFIGKIIVYRPIYVHYSEIRYFNRDRSWLRVYLVCRLHCPVHDVIVKIYFPLRRNNSNTVNLHNNIKTNLKKHHIQNVAEYSLFVTLYIFN